MARDASLQLEEKATPITTSGNGTAINTEGGFYANIRIFGGTITDADETFDIHVDASVDGTNYYPICTFPQIVAADDGIEIARPCYIPRPDAGVQYTKVRRRHVAAGTTPSNALDMFIEPLESLAPPANDEVLGVGVALLT